jgi:hypothetical protein
MKHGSGTLILQDGDDERQISGEFVDDALDIKWNVKIKMLRNGKEHGYYEGKVDNDYKPIM